MVSVNFASNDISNMAAFIGGFILIFGLVSYFVKERLFLSDSLVATIIGIIFGPVALKVMDPLNWSNENAIYQTIVHLAELVINIQIMAAAIALPVKFWKQRARAMSVLLGPVMIFMWLSTAIVFYLLLQLSFLDALVLAACTAPTDPVLANSIINGRFADEHINKRLRLILSGESAINDGIALPFFYLGIYLLKYSTGEAMGKWFLNIWLYEVGVAIILGSVIGLATRVALKFSEDHHLIDKKNFLVFEIALALFTSGISSSLGVSSFIATFMTGFVFSYDGYFVKENEEAHVQEVIDMLVNTVFFLFFGAIIPWSQFNLDTLPIWRLLITTIIILFVRRLPIVLLLSRYMNLDLTLQETIAIGWFGPIGVGALWYVSFAIINYPTISTDLYFPIISFIVFISVIVHGFTLPFIHMTLIGIRIRTMSRENVQSVPMWPVGMPLEINMIGSPVFQSDVVHHYHQNTLQSPDGVSKGLIGDVRFTIFDGDVPRVSVPEPTMIEDQSTVIVEGDVDQSKETL